jgi:dTDP-4-dehydrorhamnose reductase
LRIVADQCGAPTSARLIADVVVAIVRNNPDALAARFAASAGLLNVAASGETTWHGFAVAIIEGLKARGVALAVESVVPIATADFPTRARRPANSRFDLTRLKEMFHITTPDWSSALAVELDQLAAELNQATATR